MFTGLVQDIGNVVEIAPADAGMKIQIRSELSGDLELGDSVAVSGVCLTVAALDGDAFGADVVAETLERSTLGELRDGSRVNLELAMRASDRLGGHIVLGHVDGVGEVRSPADDGELTVELDERLMRYVVEKGSIAIDGVSLTVAALDEHSLTVALIPETRERTTLGAATGGSRVNIEVDVLAKHLEKLATPALRHGGLA